ncbi:MAG TPA: type III secretion system chaperone [Kofleriaceae bacterium]|nr:type III secretion system chaperone [Kofleriaceae bacterium]
MVDGPVDHKARVAQFLERFAHERNLTLPPLSEDGIGSIQRGSAIVTIHVLAEKEVLLVLSRVAETPTIDEARAKQLLRASFLETGDAAFALHPQTGDLYLRILRGLPGLDYEEFEDLLHTIAKLADDWDDKLA